MPKPLPRPLYLICMRTAVKQCSLQQEPHRNQNLPSMNKVAFIAGRVPVIVATPVDDRGLVCTQKEN